MDFSYKPLKFEEFIKNWIEFLNSNKYHIDSHYWNIYQQEFWKHTYQMKDPSVLDKVDLEKIPFTVRWGLAEKFLHYAKKLIIDTRSFEHSPQNAGHYRMMYNKDDLYLKHTLIPQMFKTHNNELTALLKPYINNELGYPIS